MKTLLLGPVLFLFGAIVTLSCASTSDGQAPPPDASPSADSAVKDEDGARVAPTRTGVLMPVAPVTITLWPEAYSGELLVLGVLAPGSAVKEGDVIARLDTRDIEEQIADAELGLDSARVQHAGLIEKNAIAEEAAASKLMRTQAALERARRSYEGYATLEAAFQKRSDTLVRKGEQSRIDDQKDELEQLEAMYEADELTDATEEIVLKRSRRNLALSEERNALSGDRRQYRIDLADKLEMEKRMEDVLRREEELAHMLRTQAVEARAREDAETRSTAGLRKKAQRFERLIVDLGRMTVTAPSAGILLHGSMKNYRPGGSGMLIERGGRLAARAESFLIADPSAIAIAIDVPESDLTEFPDGVAVVAHPISAPEIELHGTLSVAAYPTSSEGGESHFAGTITLLGEAPALLFGTHVEVARSEAP
jgi:HlyD family secretion protein